ncbi:MAG: protein-L-isoaspartate(D-aspartate) O-methyltransferase [Spartobacteria bacterium]|nr:protein-L-isoaspartate(D-aspartate) O-methyltransferase [Spartobacteria bacterium]
MSLSACAGEEGRTLRQKKERMIERDLKGRGIKSEKVLQAMAAVAREAFVLPFARNSAYDDRPLPIPHGQTISQPYIVALMTELACPDGDNKALEIGTGSGYQAAILGELCKEVYTIEIVPELAESAAGRLEKLGYRNVHVKAGDGYAGWPEHAPFDIILVTAAPERIPSPLLEQLAVGGRLVIPVGPVSGPQRLKLVEKLLDGEIAERDIIPVRFVPFTGEMGDTDSRNR